jgi:hypothetical protein
VNGGRPRSTRRLRSEKPHQQLGRRGFDSRHLQECSGSFREHCWRCARPSGFITIENRPSPLDRVADSNSRWLRSGPEFEVFRPIVIAHTVAVVNRFARFQVSAEQLLDDENVFEDVRTCSCARVVGHSHHDVAGLMEGSSTLPISIRRFRNCSACSARLRLCLPRPTTRTGRFAAAGRASQMSTRWLKFTSALLAMPHALNVRTRCDSLSGRRRKILCRPRTLG